MLLKSTLEALVNSLPTWSKRGLNEAQTSQAIVLRVLQALEYDIWNPFETVAQVHSGGSGGGYAPDFTVVLAGAERFVLEVKALDKTFSVGDREQPVSYANNKGLRWAVLTNGSEWQFFDNRIPKPAAEKRALTVELKHPRAADYFGRLLGRDVWLKSGAEDALATVVQEVAEEIDKHLKLSEIEVKLANELGAGFTPDAKGLARAIALTLEPNERELAEKAFDDLAKRLLNIDAAPPPTPPQSTVVPGPIKPVDACKTIIEGMRCTVPTHRKAVEESFRRGWATQNFRQ
jgi:hypothetical protein